MRFIFELFFPEAKVSSHLQDGAAESSINLMLKRIKDLPKSRNPIRPSRSNHKLPACTSAWKVSHASKLPNLKEFSQGLRS